MRHGVLCCTILLGSMLVPSLALAQGGGGGRRNFDPAQIRDFMMNNIKEQLEVTDNEWKVLSPKVERVLLAQAEVRGLGRIRGFIGANALPQTPVTIAQTELQAALENKDMPPEGIARRLAALRAARDRARVTLQEAQADLKDLLTQRQEAMLVNMGMLD
jgi:hypothetical protein